MGDFGKTHDSEARNLKARWLNVLLRAKRSLPVCSLLLSLCRQLRFCHLNPRFWNACMTATGSARELLESGTFLLTPYEMFGGNVCSELGNARWKPAKYIKKKKKIMQWIKLSVFTVKRLTVAQNNVGNKMKKCICRLISFIRVNTTFPRNILLPECNISCFL